MFMWIESIQHRLIAFFVAALLFLPAMAGAQMWTELSTVQQEVLAPLAQSWNTLPKKQQLHLLKLVNHYPKLTPVQKERLHKRLEAWSKLTPEQRKRAREKYQAFSKVPPEKREQVKIMLREQEAGKAAASAVVPASPMPAH
jgi:uncharacterized membrane protein